MARRGNPARLVIALSVAAALAVFLIYTSLAGGGTPQIEPSQLAAHRGKVQLVGVVVGPKRGDGYAEALRFRLRDITGPRRVTVPVVYRGTVPPLFRIGRDVTITGTYRQGTFAAEKDSLITKCPSKYSPKS